MDPRRFFNYTRMTQETLNYTRFLKKVEHSLVKTCCNWHRHPNLPEERLVITMR